MAYEYPAERLEEITDIGSSASGFLVDWDGCCALGNTLIPEAAAFLRAHQERVAIVSNNSTCTPEDFQVTLKRDGIELPCNRILLAGIEALHRATDWNGVNTMVLGDPHMRGIARNLGLSLTQEDADTVVLLRDRRFTYRRLERAVNSLAAGAHLIVANPDLTHPAPDGGLKPETGSLLAAMRACVDLDETRMDIVGKPSPHLFQLGCKALGMAPEEVVMLGDNPMTDIAGAQALGMQAILTSARSPHVFDALAKGRGG